MDQKTINLSLSLNEVNIILNSLSQLPYAQVKDLIEKVQAQGTEQLKEEAAV